MKKTQLFLLAIIIATLALAALISYTLWEKNHEGNFLTLYGNIDIRQVDLGFRVPGKLKACASPSGRTDDRG